MTFSSTVLRLPSLMVSYMTSREGPRHYYIVYFGNSTRTFFGAPGVLNMLEGKITDNDFELVNQFVSQHEEQQTEALAAA